MSSAIPHILLAEDSPDDLYFFRWCLQSGGIACEITHAADGLEALDLLQKYFRDPTFVESGGKLPDIIFLDLKMPGLSGFEVLERLNVPSLPAQPEIHVLSGSDQRSDRARSTALGAAGYFVKPMLINQLRAVVDAWRVKQAGNGVPHAG